MTFLSARRPGEFVIDDSNAHKFAEELERSTEFAIGYRPRDWSLATGVAQAFNVPLIPRDAWAAMIEARERAGQLLSRISDLAGLKSLNQGNTNYCWCNAVITAMEALRAAAGLPYVPLSPASVAAPIKGFRNQGGWGSEALAYIVENGVAPVSNWPANAIDRKYHTVANQEAAKRGRVTEWYDLRAKSFDQLMTCLLMGLPVPIGLLWWGHEVCAIDPVVIAPNRFGVRIRNSWGDSWGDRGFAILEESKAVPDDAVAPRVVTVL